MYEEVHAINLDQEDDHLYDIETVFSEDSGYQDWDSLPSISSGNVHFV